VSEFKDENVDLESTASSEVGESTDDAVAEEPTAEASSAEASTVEGTEVAATDEPAVDEAADEPSGQDVGSAAQVADESDELTVEEAGAEDEEAAPDPLEEFRAALRSKPGDWYVVHTYSGMEKRVKANLENRITSLNMEDFIYEVHVPQEDVWEVKNGQRKQVSRTVLPGYVLVRMDLTDESWSAVRHTPSVTGFVGHSHQPVPLSLAEVEAMLAPTITEEKAAPEAKTQKKVEFTDFAVNDSVLIVDGAFATLHATITEMNVDAQRVKALVEIFGRETPVELSFSQIQKV
jgi:transcriptional antiterminator NusG